MVNNGFASNNYPITGFTTDCDVKYKSNPDGTLTFTFSNCMGPITAGGSAGGTTGSYTDSVESATVSFDLITLLLADIEPDVESTWYTYNNVTYENKRICSRTAVAVRLPIWPHR
jgi:hypothetical protein